MALVTVGGKGFSLSSASVHSIAACLSSLQIDPSALDKLHKSTPSKPPSSSTAISPAAAASDHPVNLSAEESRASLVVLLSKLLSSDTPLRPLLPSLLLQTLTLPSLPAETLDLTSLLNLRHIHPDLFSPTPQELAAVARSFFAPIAISALLDRHSSALLTVADSATALSSEAAHADACSAFHLPVSADGYSLKDEIDVASDLRDLLLGSKFLGSTDADAFSDVPSVHGSFRSAARSLHALVAVELNSPVRAGQRGSGKGKALVAPALSLAVTMLSVAECSFGRAKLAIGSIGDVELRARVAELFEKNCPGFNCLRDAFQSISIKAGSDLDPAVVLHEIYDLMVKLRVALAWEAAIALLVLETFELGEAELSDALPTPVVNGGNASLGKKNEKKNKKKKVLGRGTTVIRQFLKEKLTGITNPANVSGVLVEWAQGLCSFFDPKDPELYTLLQKVKDIVESNEVRRLPKIPKGTRDFGKEQMAIRESAFSIIVSVFKRHGGVALDTPVFELRETLMGKYGGDSKLIYDLADQGGEICSLRYDLTVPFARYLAMNNINALKRYQIAKVYRRDNPSKGRFREFYQCDFDIAGQYDGMEPDFEVLKVLTELLDELNIGDYEIKLNHRKLLDGMLEICGVAPEKFRTVCSSIDKLDKQSFDQVKKELVEEKGLAVQTADKIGSFLKKRGHPLELLSDLKQEGSQFLGNSGSVSALTDLEILFRALEKSKCLHRVVFDLSLARGLDYYTGVIFEAVFKGSTQVGSIGAGGRYDNLVGMFSGKQVPAVGVSLGIERVFTIMEEQLQKDKNQLIRVTETQVLVVLLGKDLALAAELVSELWNAKLKAEFAVAKKVVKQIERAIQAGIPYMVIVGESELEQGVANIKEIATNTQVTVPREKVVEELQRRANTSCQSNSERYVIL